MKTVADFPLVEKAFALWQKMKAGSPTDCENSTKSIVVRLTARQTGSGRPRRCWKENPWATGMRSAVKRSPGFIRS